MVDWFCYIWTTIRQIISPASLSDQIFSIFLIRGLTVNKINQLSINKVNVQSKYIVQNVVEWKHEVKENKKYSSKVKVPQNCTWVNSSHSV